MPFPALPPISDDITMDVFTHKGYHGGVHTESSREHADWLRLAFLGDAVLQYHTTTWLWNKYKGNTIGKLTEKRAQLVSNKTLATWATKYELQSKIRAHPSTAFRLHTIPSEKISGSLFEAYLAAVSLTGTDGLSNAKRWIEDILEFEHGEDGKFHAGNGLVNGASEGDREAGGGAGSEAGGKAGCDDAEMGGDGIAQEAPKGYVNHLSALNERAAQKGWYPIWKQDCSGPEHHKAWRAVLTISGQEFHGDGNTIKEAKNVAAKKAWDALMG